jgi:hypothetical protein
VFTEVVPSKISIPFNGPLTTETQIDVSWMPLTTSAAMGGATCSIISYNLEWDRGTNGLEWHELTGVYSIYQSSNYVHKEDISSGNTYQFRVKAKNKHGWGPYSDIVSILAAIVPDAPF